MPSPVPTTSESSRPDDDHHGGGAAWETDHPYKKPNDGDDFQPAWEAACHCGRVQYAIGREEPLASKYCHCSDCQRMHAAPFQWAAIFHKADLRFRHGVDGLAFYCPTLAQPVHHLPCKVYCATCHAPLLDEGRNMVMLFPELIRGIHTDERAKKAFRLGHHLCWGSRLVQDGVFEGDGVKKWAGVDGRSELLDDGTGAGTK